MGRMKQYELDSLVARDEKNEKQIDIVTGIYNQKT